MNQIYDISNLISVYTNYISNSNYFINKNSFSNTNYFSNKIIQIILVNKILQIILVNKIIQIISVMQIISVSYKFFHLTNYFSTLYNTKCAYLPIVIVKQINRTDDQMRWTLENSNLSFDVSVLECLLISVYAIPEPNKMYLIRPDP